MKQLAVFLIRMYQKVLSPLKGRPTCRFYPTCSAYGIRAYTEWGFLCGTVLTVWRVLRCNPFCRGGLDPVPVRYFRPVRHRPQSMGAWSAPFCLRTQDAEGTGQAEAGTNAECAKQNAE